MVKMSKPCQEEHGLTGQSVAMPAGQGSSDTSELSSVLIPAWHAPVPDTITPMAVGCRTPLHALRMGCPALPGALQAQPLPRTTVALLAELPPRAGALVSSYKREENTENSRLLSHQQELTSGWQQEQRSNSRELS